MLHALVTAVICFLNDIPAKVCAEPQCIAHSILLPSTDHLNPLMMSLATCKRLTSLKLKHVTLSSEDLVVVVKDLSNLTALKLKNVYLSDENKVTEVCLHVSKI